jgi:magnesium transporter
MIGFDTYFVRSAGTLDALNSLEEGMNLLNAGTPGYLWLDYFRPTQENLSVLADLFQIHFLSIEDCLDDEQIPKINEYENYVQVLFNKFSYRDKGVLIEEINLFAGKNFLITVEKNNKNADGNFKAYREILRDEIRKAKLGPVFAMHIILDHIVDNKFSVIEAVGDDLSRLEDTMTLHHKNFDQSSLQNIRQTLMALRKSLFHEREIFVKISRNDIDIVPDAAIVHFNDIYDHITKFFELTEIYREMVTNLIQTNLAMINNDIAIAANNTNSSVKRLTLITTIFMPLALLSGIGGMSEFTMMTGAGNWKTAYSVLAVVFLLIAAVNYLLLKLLDRKK